MSTAIPPTLSVPEFGRRFLDVGRDASYAAAERGDFRVIRVGRSLRVPMWAALKQLGWSDEAIAIAMGLGPDSTDGESPAQASPSNVRSLATTTPPGGDHLGGGAA